MEALVGAFNQEKALVGAFSAIVKTGCGTDGALHSTNFVGCNDVRVSGGVLIVGAHSFSAHFAENQSWIVLAPAPIVA